MEVTPSHLTSQDGAPEHASDAQGNALRRLEIARLRSEGKSDKEAMRCLKRQLSNVVFRQLIADLKGSEIAA